MSRAWDKEKASVPNSIQTNDLPKSLGTQTFSLSHAGDMLIIIFLFSQKGNGFKIRSVGNNLTCKETRTLRTRNQTNIILAVSSAGLEKNLEFQLILWAGISHNLLAQGLHFLLALVNDLSISGCLARTLAHCVLYS